VACTLLEEEEEEEEERSFALLKGRFCRLQFINVS
jgi:hypothetical protein